MGNFNLFNSIRVKKPKRNRFDLSHDVKTTAQFGILTPILCQPVLPGDTFKLNTEILCRFAPFQAPVMHNCKIYTHFYFVPNRLLWKNWKEFITGGEDGKAAPLYPRFRIKGSLRNIYFGNGSLADYLGFPSYDKKQHGADYGDVDALPFRAYSLIWNEYYRDQNLQEEIDIQFDRDGIIEPQKAVIGSNGSNKAPGIVIPNPGYDDIVNEGEGDTSVRLVDPLLQLHKRAWKKDYFTSALPFAQRGDDVELPIFGGVGEVEYNDDASAVTNGAGIGYAFDDGTFNKPFQYSESDVRLSDSGLLKAETASNSKNIWLGNTNDKSGNGGVIQTYLHSDELRKLISKVNVSQVNSATVEEIRRCVKAQEFLEAMARGGSRYIEQIYSIFGVRSSDARLQRPEFLGGGKSPVVISDVLQTSQSTEGNPLATPAGHGVSVQNTHSFKRYFEEHGYVIGIMSIMPMPAYQQGMPKVFTKFDRLDYYWPQFAHLGEQEITQGEIYHTGDPEQDEKLFGYTPRYAEYKYIPDSVHGDFRGNLSFWHMGRIFDSPPALNEDFITNVADAANRPFAVQDASFDKIWINIHHNLKAYRLMPVYGTPRL